MGFERPTLDTLIERVDSSIKGTLNLTTVLRRSFIGVISRAIAGMSHLMLGYLTFISRQVFPDTAELEFLDRWASIWGVIRNESTFAQFEIQFTGTDGGVIPSGTVLQRDDGTQYETDSEGIIASGIVNVQVTASVSGSGGDMNSGDVLNLLSPIANVESEASIISIVTDADDTESDESLRERLIDRLQLPPLGGSANDYLQWQREVTGVTRAWVLPLQFGPGTVGCSFVTDNEDPIIPSAAKVAEVQEYIAFRKPVTAIVTVYAPTEAAIDLEISIKPNTTQVQESIVEQLRDLVLRDVNLAGSYGGPGIINDGSLLLSRIRQAVSLGVGLEDFQVDTINGLAPANIIPNTGELITLGTVTWQTLP